MRVRSLTLDRFGAFTDRTINFGPGLTLVMGANEAGKSTALAALSDLLWGIPPACRYAFLHARQSLLLHALLELPEADASVTVARRYTGLTDLGAGGAVSTPWVASAIDTRVRWRQSFGLSHDELRKGGIELCSGTGDLAELIFTARSGQAVRQLLEKIDLEADALYKVNRGAKSVEVRTAHTAYEVAIARVRESTTASDLVRAVRDDLDHCERDVAAARMGRDSTQLKATTLERRAEAADHARSVAVLDREVQELRALGVVLDEEQLARWMVLDGRSMRAGQSRDTLGPQVDELLHKRAGISQDTDLLSDEKRIIQLHLAAAAVQADGARAQQVFEQAEDSERHAATELEKLVGSLGEQSVADVLAAWHVSAERAVQLDAQAVLMGQVADKVERAETVVAATKVQLEEAGSDGHDLDMDAVLGVREVLSTVIEAGSATSRLLKAVDLLAGESTERDEALQRAGAPSALGVVEPLPSAQAVDSARVAVSEARSTAALAHAAFEREQAAVEAAMQRRVEADIDDLPQVSDLSAARAARDQSLDEATQAWSSGQSFEQSGHLLAQAREAVLAADDFSDRLARGADVAARRAELDSAVVIGEAEVARAREAMETADHDSERATTAWGELWAASGLCPTLTQGTTVQLQLVEARDAQTRANEHRVRIEQLKPLAAKQAIALETALDRAGRLRPSSDLDSLVSAAEQLIRDADDDREARAAVEQRQKDLRHALEAHAAAISAQNVALTSWSGLLVSAGVPGDLDPAAWAERQLVIRAARSANEVARQKRQEAEVLAENHAAFLSEVRTLGERHGEEGPGESAVIEQLATRVTRARAAGVEALRLDAQLKRLGDELAAARTELETAVAALNGLADETLAGDLVSLAAAAARGETAADLRVERTRLRDLVRASASVPDEDVGALIHELAATETQDLEQALTDARSIASDAEVELTAAVQRRGELSQRERDLTSAGGAAELNAQAQEKLAVVAQNAERFLVADIQRRLLRQELTEYESRHASPLLDVAGGMLERLTEGRFVALRTTSSGASRGLLVVGADGDERTPDKLSEGTADQVFLALRLAGIASLQNERQAQGAPTLPVVFDDVLMAFDDNRARAAVTLMAELAEHWQIIVMTHHEHVLHLVTTFPAEIAAIATLAGPDEMVTAGTAESVRAMARSATVGGEPVASAGHRQPRVEGRTDTSSIRAWARANGHEIGDRGRIPVQVIAAYDAAHG